MKARFLVSVINLFLALALVSGAAWAWFSQSIVMASPFTAGTVQITEPELLSTGQGNNCIDLGWLLQSTGSKRSYIRVRPTLEGGQTGDESAWLQGIPIDGDWWFGQYLEYSKGSCTENAPLQADFVQGPNLNVLGRADIWDDGDTLYVKYQMNNGVTFNETHFYAGLAIPTITTPGLYPLGDEDLAATEYTVELTEIFRACEKNSPQDVSFSTLNNGCPIYIAVHIGESGYTQGQLSLEFSSDWVLGSDGWWYYGNSQGPITVAPGGAVAVNFSVCTTSGSFGQLMVQLEAEAVQTTHGAIDALWPGNPWLLGSD